MFYLYILYNPHIDKFYVGHSDDPWRRVQEHNNQNTEKFTGKYLGWELKAVFNAGKSRSEAMKIESWIKKQKSRNLIEKLISPDFMPDDKLAQLVRVPHLRD